ncbi:MAG: hypothetical protein IPL95_10930 [Saprospiraceae bacterium]|nr:hypothetical protein [Saprospiraceae bacterium]
MNFILRLPKLFLFLLSVAMPDFNSLQNEMPGLTIPSASSGLEYHWPTVVNASYGFLMAKLFP